MSHWPAVGLRRCTAHSLPHLQPLMGGNSAQKRDERGRPFSRPPLPPLYAIQLQQFDREWCACVLVCLQVARQTAANWERRPQNASLPSQPDKINDLDKTGGRRVVRSNCFMSGPMHFEALASGKSATLQEWQGRCRPSPLPPLLAPSPSSSLAYLHPV